MIEITPTIFNKIEKEYFHTVILHKTTKEEFTNHVSCRNVVLVEREVDPITMAKEFPCTLAIYGRGLDEELKKYCEHNGVQYFEHEEGKRIRLDYLPYFGFNYKEYGIVLSPKQSEEVRPLRVCHFGAFTPGQSGMYETLRELVQLQRTRGIDARLVATKDQGEIEKSPKYDQKYYFSNAEYNFALEADIWVGHSCIPPEIKFITKPTVFCLHGVPSRCFLDEYHGRGRYFTSLIEVCTDPTTHSIVTFWKEHMDWLAPFTGKERIYHVPAPCIRENYNRKNIKPWGGFEDFRQAKGLSSVAPVIISFDTDRAMKEPIYAIMGFNKYWEMNPDSMFAFYGVDPEKIDWWKWVISRMPFHKNVIEICPMIDNMERVIAATSVVYTTQDIATRVVRESTAVGIPVVAGGYEGTDYNANPQKPREIASALSRAIAKKKISKKAFGEPHEILNHMAHVYQNALDEYKTCGSFSVATKEVDGGKRYLKPNVINKTYNVDDMNHPYVENALSKLREKVNGSFYRNEKLDLWVASQFYENLELYEGDVLSIGEENKILTAQLLEERNAHVFGVYDMQLDEEKKKQTINGLFLDIPFPKEYDKVVIPGFLNHVSDQFHEPFLAKCVDLLKPGGYLALEFNFGANIQDSGYRSKKDLKSRLIDLLSDRMEILGNENFEILTEWREDPPQDNNITVGIMFFRKREENK